MKITPVIIYRSIGVNERTKIITKKLHLNMSIRKLSPELSKKAKDELFEDPDRIASDLKAIKEWIAKQPHLMARTDDQWLIAFLRGCKYSLERTKEKIDLFYTLRTAIPDIAMPRDPMDPKVQEILKSGLFVPIFKTVNPDDPCASIYRGSSYDPSKVNISDIMCVALMMTNLRLLKDDQFVIAGNIGINDHKDTSLAHLTQMTPSLVKKIAMCVQDAMPLRDKGNHHINTFPGLESIFNIFKMFLNEKSKSRLYIHTDPEAIYKFIPKEFLPVEYGGSGGTIQEITDLCRKEIENNREWFLEDMKYKTNESKRVGSPKTSETLFGIEGSFRQLAVD